MTLVIEPEVADALSANRPVVALESTIIAHGLPWPDNLALATELEQVVRDAGAAPATIAIVAGRARIGLGADELATFAERAGADAGRLGVRSGGSGDAVAGRGPAIAKAGAADLAVHMAGRTDAATTVSATAVLAARAGIRVFATGGIGGVHRGDAGDVSHDLYALASTRIAVVSAGAKAILDLPRTLELLESLGVLVIGVGTDELPAFYTRTSGVKLDHRVDDVADLAAILRVRWHDLAQGGALICNPIPAAAELPAAEIDGAIATALADAAAANVTGKRLTPYLLARLATLTGGRAVVANRALARANAELAARLAGAMV